MRIHESKQVLPRLGNSLAFDFFIIINRFSVRFELVSCIFDDASLVPILDDSSGGLSPIVFVERFSCNRECERKYPSYLTEFVIGNFAETFSVLFIVVAFVLFTNDDD